MLVLLAPHPQSIGLDRLDPFGELYEEMWEKYEWEMVWRKNRWWMMVFIDNLDELRIKINNN